ncbi:MAG TPA: hypothetical protein VFZ24_08260 [Longimicrobiales bacterium]
MSALIDDRSQPTLREHIRGLLSSCTSADIAVGHIRPAAIDLTDDETRGIHRARILVARLEARALSEFAGTAAGSPDPLLRFLESGRVEVRSAGIGAWAPDFSIYRGGAAGDACLIGAHWFREPVVSAGPSLTALLTEPDVVARALERFEELWRRSHDVLEPVIAAVSRRQSFHAT